MQCPHCGCQHVRKNGWRRGQQNHICVGCGRQFIKTHKPRGYSDDTRKLCLKMYVNGMGLRQISRVTDISHTTVMNWVRQVGENLSQAQAQEPEIIPEVGELDELETFVGKKNAKFSFGR